MASDYLVQEEDGISKFALEEGGGFILLEESGGGVAAHRSGFRRSGHRGWLALLGASPAILGWLAR